MYVHFHLGSHWVCVCVCVVWEEFFSCSKRKEKNRKNNALTLYTVWPNLAAYFVCCCSSLVDRLFHFDFDRFFFSFFIHHSLLCTSHSLAFRKLVNNIQTENKKKKKKEAKKKKIRKCAHCILYAMKCDRYYCYLFVSLHSFNCICVLVFVCVYKSIGVAIVMLRSTWIVSMCIFFILSSPKLTEFQVLSTNFEQQQKLFKRTKKKKKKNAKIM